MLSARSPAARRSSAPPAAAANHSGLSLPAVRRGLQPLHGHALLEDLLSLFHDCADPAWHRSRYPNPASLRRIGHQPHPPALATTPDTRARGGAFFPLPHHSPTR